MKKRVPGMRKHRAGRNSPEQERAAAGSPSVWYLEGVETSSRRVGES